LLLNLLVPLLVLLSLLGFFLLLLLPLLLLLLLSPPLQVLQHINLPLPVSSPLLKLLLPSSLLLQFLINPIPPLQLVLPRSRPSLRSKRGSSRSLALSFVLVCGKRRSALWIGRELNLEAAERVVQVTHEAFEPNLQEDTQLQAS